MKLFISWSGDRSEALAKALYDWLPLVLHYCEPWLSKSDIKAGDRWSVEVAKELEQCNFGILCVTKENIASPWILFEAGALAKSMQDGRVIPLLLDLDFKEISGPLAQFQAKKVEKDGVYELIQSLNKAHTPPVAEAQLDKLFGALWPDLQTQVGNIPVATNTSKHSRPQGEILEELVASIRNVELRIRDVTEEGSRPMRRRHKNYTVVMNDTTEFLPHNHPLRLLMIAGLIKDDASIIYDLTWDLYKSLIEWEKSMVAPHARMLIEAVDMFRRTSLVDNGVTDRALLMLAEEATSVLKGESEIRPTGLGDFVHRPPPKPAAKK